MRGQLQFYIRLLSSRIFLIKPPQMQFQHIPSTPLKFAQNPGSPCREHPLDLKIDPHPESNKQELLALLAKLDVLERRLAYLEKKARESASPQKKRKKNRRKNEQLSKRFKCLNKECAKVYDSVTSLKFHMRNKHQISVKKKRLQDVIFQVDNYN